MIQQQIPLTKENRFERVRCVRWIVRGKGKNETRIQIAKQLPYLQTFKGHFSHNGWKIEDPQFNGGTAKTETWQTMKKAAKAKGMDITNKTTKQDIIDWSNNPENK